MHAAGEGVSVRLRAWTTGDEDALAALFDDPLVYRFTPIQEPFDVDAARRRIAAVTRGEASGTIVCRAVITSDELVGEVAAYSLPPLITGDAAASISYVIGSAWRGKHLARDAVTLLIEEVRERWSVTRFIAEIAPENPASKRVAESLGFVQDAHAEPTPREGKDYAVMPWYLDVTKTRSA